MESFLDDPLLEGMVDDRMVEAEGFSELFEDLRVKHARQYGRFPLRGLCFNERSIAFSTAPEDELDKVKL
jgi:hypothetical protein